MFLKKKNKIMTEKEFSLLSAYCVENIESYSERLHIAMEKMGKTGLPLWNADRDFYLDLCYTIDKYCQENSIDSDSVYAEDVCFETY
jgi:hypothetical protein